MPFAKVTYFLEDPEGYGDSQSFYASYSDSLNELLAPAQSLFKARLGLCGDGIVGTYLRISDDSIQGDALVDTTTYFVGQSAQDAPSTGGNQKNPSILKPGVPDSPPCLPNLVLSVRFQIGTRYHAIKYLHGLPIAVITTPPGPAFVGDFINAWNQWNKQFPATGGLWRLKVKLSTGVNAKTPVQTIIGTAPDPVVITAPGHQITQGQVFRLGGFRNLAGIKGTYIAGSVVAGTSISVTGGVPIANIKVPLKGYVQSNGYDYLAITSMQADQETFHKAGRPFGQRPGRRKVVRSS